ncbi:hypothetical protein ORV05_05030 [Amycolatopsis cynarae]|uniref:Uncharacterized protein n=1 Tax=Amycolatopsis cynarae TaxID=2995223 RepID=A0ABY7B8G6_9PSEU|nr:hypothetical protein [Amycolatopsis sp. HUAS 11-8]WAL67156.1 hypothetical protein ORV05_05030 [Amycolatopsis sp. HUAS 11-8]
MTWQAAHNGFPGDYSAADASAQINQFLGTHPSSEVWHGTRIVDCAAWNELQQWGSLSAQDISQPFVLPAGSTSIGRIMLPVTPIGKGDDLLVSLWTDNAGVPGTQLASTVVPAKWFTAQAAIAANGGLVGATSPLQTSLVNCLRPGYLVYQNWRPPATSPNGYAISGAALSVGNFGVVIGGFDSSTNNNVSTVYSIQYLGNGALGAPIPQTSLPQALSNLCAAATADGTIIVAGGRATSAVSSMTATVFASQLNANAGSVGSWSTQTSLPAPRDSGALVSWGQFVYYIGGLDTTGTSQATVYWAQVQNGQVGAWKTGPSLPGPLDSMAAGVVDGQIIVTAGNNSVAGVKNTTTYIAPLNSDGSVVGWFNASAPLPAAVSSVSGVALPGVGLVFSGGLNSAAGFDTTLHSLTVSPTTGVSVVKTSVATGSGQYGYPLVAFQRGDGNWDTFTLFSNAVWWVTYFHTPDIPIPLPVTGLTGGATYHVMLQQRGQDPNNYLTFDLSYSSLSTILTSNRWAYSWANAGNGFSLPIEVWDNSVPGDVPRLHGLWEDSDSRATALQIANGGNGRLIGAVDAVQIGPTLMNANSTFETGIANWGPITGGTAAWSSTVAHSGTHSMQLTPDGVSIYTAAECEPEPVTPGEFITAKAWAYFTNAVTNHYVIVLYWWGATGSHLYGSVGPYFSASAATWTQASFSAVVPQGAAYASMHIKLDGTPAASQIWYIDDATLTRAVPKVQGGAWSYTYDSLGNVTGVNQF